MRVFSVVMMAVLCAGCHRTGGKATATSVRDRDVQKLEQLNTRLDTVAASMSRLGEIVAELADMPGKFDAAVDIEWRLEALAAEVDQLRSSLGSSYRRYYRSHRPRDGLVYSIPIAGDPFDGPVHAKITIVEVFDFACPYCRRARETLDQVVQKYGADVKIVYKTLVIRRHRSTIPAMAACAAHRQGRYLEMAELMWNRLWPKDVYSGGPATVAAMEELAQEAGLDLALFQHDVNGDRCRKYLAETREQLGAVGARSTPSFFINGRYLSGSHPLSRFSAVIDEELRKVDNAHKRGVAVEDYYQRFVVKLGRKKP